MAPTRDTSGDMDYGPLGQPVTKAVLQRFYTQGKATDERLPIGPTVAREHGAEFVSERVPLPTSARVAMINSNDPVDADMSVRQAIRDNYGKPEGLGAVFMDNGRMADGSFNLIKALSKMPQSWVQSVFNPAYNASNQLQAGLSRGDVRGAIEDFSTSAGTSGANALAGVTAPNVLGGAALSRLALTRPVANAATPGAATLSRGLAGSLRTMPGEVASGLRQVPAVFRNARAAHGLISSGVDAWTAGMLRGTGSAALQGTRAVAAPAIRNGMNALWSQQLVQGVAPYGKNLGQAAASVHRLSSVPGIAATAANAVYSGVSPNVHVPGMAGAALAAANMAGMVPREQITGIPDRIDQLAGQLTNDVVLDNR